MITKAKGNGHEKLWTWFGLSRASFCVMPRVLMHEMPDEWQSKMADLLNEYDETFDTECGVDEAIVQGKKDNKFCKWPDWVLNYRHPDRKKIDSIRLTQ